MRSLPAALLLIVSSMTLSAQAPPPSTGGPAVEARPSFTDWLDGVRQEARTRGISEATVDAALGNIPEPLPVVLERDRAQAETVLPLETYIRRGMTQARVRRGREMTTRHKSALDKVAEDYGVPSRIIAGIWGVESNFGAFSGTRPTIDSLATLAYDPRRSTLFRRELFSALEILDRGDIEHARMRGSWAGAMGQPQFMPSSYLAFAVDYDKDGRKDIWNTTEDVFASIGNYLKGHGWKTGQPYVREVTVSKAVATTIAANVARRNGSCSARRDMTVALPLDEWQEIGVRSVVGRALPKSGERASLVSGSARSFLVFDNYDALLEYNCAHAYALTVALLGERILGTPPPPAVRPVAPTAPRATAAPRAPVAPRAPAAPRRPAR